MVSVLKQNLLHQQKSGHFFSIGLTTSTLVVSLESRVSPTHRREGRKDERGGRTGDDDTAPSFSFVRFSSLIRVGLPDRRLSRGSSWSFSNVPYLLLSPPVIPDISRLDYYVLSCYHTFTSTFTPIPIENVETAIFTRDNDVDGNDAVLLGGGGGGATNCR